MAMANMLGYLEERYNAMPLVWNLPHDHVFGFGWLSAGSDVCPALTLPRSNAPVISSCPIS